MLNRKKYKSLIDTTNDLQQIQDQFNNLVSIKTNIEQNIGKLTNISNTLSQITIQPKVAPEEKEDDEFILYQLLTTGKYHDAINMCTHRIFLLQLVEDAILEECIKKEWKCKEVIVELIYAHSMQCLLDKSRIISAIAIKKNKWKSVGEFSLTDQIHSILLSLYYYIAAKISNSQPKTSKTNNIASCLEKLKTRIDTLINIKLVLQPSEENTIFKDLLAYSELMKPLEIKLEVGSDQMMKYISLIESTTVSMINEAWQESMPEIKQYFDSSVNITEITDIIQQFLVCFGNKISKDTMENVVTLIGASMNALIKKLLDCLITLEEKPIANNNDPLFDSLSHYVQSRYHSTNLIKSTKSIDKVMQDIEDMIAKLQPTAIADRIISILSDIITYVSSQICNIFYKQNEPPIHYLNIALNFNTRANDICSRNNIPISAEYSHKMHTSYMHFINSSILKYLQGIEARCSNQNYIAQEVYLFSPIALLFSPISLPAINSDLSQYAFQELLNASNRIPKEKFAMIMAHIHECFFSKNPRCKAILLTAIQEIPQIDASKMQWCAPTPLLLENCKPGKCIIQISNNSLSNSAVPGIADAEITTKIQEIKAELLFGQKDERRKKRAVDSVTNILKKLN